MGALDRPFKFPQSRLESFYLVTPKVSRIRLCCLGYACLKFSKMIARLYRLTATRPYATNVYVNTIEGGA